MSFPFYQHYLKESFIPLVSKYKVNVKLVDGIVNDDDDIDGMLSLFLNCDAPGKEFGIDTDEEISHWWELTTFVDESKSAFGLMSMDPKTGEMKPADGRYFLFDWRGKIKSQTMLTVDENTFLSFLNYLFFDNSNNQILSLDEVKRIRIINQFF